MSTPKNMYFVFESPDLGVPLAIFKQHQDAVEWMEDNKFNYPKAFIDTYALEFKE